jgi:hypothetical protein
MVRARLVEAFEIDRRMPRDRRRVATAWPATPVHTFVDMVYWDEGEASERVMQSWERTDASPQEVTRMEDAFEWLRWLPIAERQMLTSWAFATATHRSVTAIMNKRSLKRTSFYRLRDRAADRIAYRLNQSGVQVR